jgi:hypothetical protein
VDGIQQITVAERVQKTPQRVHQQRGDDEHGATNQPWLPALQRGD